MSDLAYSCEYLHIDKTCAIISDNSKAKVNRQLNCKNCQNITVCCYLCMSRAQCATSCKYLERSVSHVVEPQCVTENVRPVVDVEDFNVESSHFENVPVAFCFSCDVAMAWTKTQLSIDNWRGSISSVLDSGDKVLSVVVLLCPKCGKIEFKADAIKKE